MALSLAISADESIDPDADTFDGLPYYNLLLRSKEDENMYQFTSTSKNMMHFGAGRHACPGRWFASAEIKMILPGLILEYDFKLKEGDGRPKKIVSQYQNMPNPMAEILFKKLQL
jgi:cytochrome P450